MQEKILKTPWDDHFMLPDFLGCMRWALGQPELMERYRLETGDTFTPAATPAERMIDEATGADFAFLQRFSDWVATNLFGRPEDLDAKEDKA